VAMRGLETIQMTGSPSSRLDGFSQTMSGSAVTQLAGSTEAWCGTWVARRTDKPLKSRIRATSG